MITTVDVIYVQGRARPRRLFRLRLERFSSRKAVFARGSRGKFSATRFTTEVPVIVSVPLFTVEIVPVTIGTILQQQELGLNSRSSGMSNRLMTGVTKAFTSAGTTEIRVLATVVSTLEPPIILANVFVVKMTEITRNVVRVRSPTTPRRRLISGQPMTSRM